MRALSAAVAQLILVRCMPPAFKVALVISLVVVLANCRSSSRASSFVLAVIAPFVITAFLWLLNSFMAADYAMGWSWLLGGILVFVPSAIICMAAVAIVFWWKGRSSREENRNI